MNPALWTDVDAGLALVAALAGVLFGLLGGIHALLPERRKDTNDPPDSSA